MNDPLNGMDPEGLWWEAASGAFQNLTRSDFAATASGMLQTMADPYVSFYQRTVVQPFYAAAGAIAQSPLGDPGLYASLQGLGAPGAVAAGVASTTANTFGAIARFGGVPGPASQLAANSAAGAAYERTIGAQLQQSGLVVGEQVTVRTMGGTRTRLDFVTRDPASGVVGCVECKASPTAPLTTNQRLAFPEIGQSGGTVVGAGKPGFPGGMRIPPTDVQIFRGP